jgi:hypothetical protein
VQPGPRLADAQVVAGANEGLIGEDVTDVDAGAPGAAMADDARAARTGNDAAVAAGVEGVAADTIARGQLWLTQVAEPDAEAHVYEVGAGVRLAWRSNSTRRTGRASRPARNRGRAVGG